MLITSPGELESFIERANLAPVLAIDTEFLREKTYYSKLCLLQMATPDEVVLVDPLAIKDLHPLQKLMQNQSIVKVFHAAYQDLEILLHELGALPTPVFDTQVAATLLGYSQQIGYGALVASLCGISLKKSDSYTDWSRRPLTESQLDYAADDVLYLPKMYTIMRDSLIAKNRLHWLDEDFALMSNPDQFEENPRDRWRRLKRVSHLSRRQLSCARELAAWRETEAQKRNIPRKWILTDEQVVEICKKEAATINDLFLVRGVKEHLSMHDARAVAAAVKKGLDASEKSYPQLPSPTKNEANVDAVVDILSAVARVRAKQFGVAFQTLAPRDELVKLARGYIEESELVHGWRKSMVGDELVDLLAGKLRLDISNAHIRISSVGEQ